MASNGLEDLDKPYRRGLILGLSLAEIFLLLVFLLLLVTVGYAGLVFEEKEEILNKSDNVSKTLQKYEDLFEENDLSFDNASTIFILFKENLANNLSWEPQLKEMIKKAKKHEELINKIEEVTVKKNELEKERDMLLAEKKGLLDQINLLTDNNQTIADLLIINQELKRDKFELENELKAKNSALENLKILYEQLLVEKEKVDKELEKALEKIQKLKKTIPKLEETVDENTELKQKNKELQEQNDNLSVQVGNFTETLQGFLNDGTLKISCWTQKIEGRQKPKTINIFDILITDNGITIADKKPIDKFKDIKPKLPLDKIQFNKTLTIQEFFSQTKDLFDYGNSGNTIAEYPCRYNVQIYRNVADGNTYNRFEYRVEDRFYIYRVQELKWPY